MEIRSHRGRRLRRRQKLKCGFGDDAEHTFRAAHQAGEIEPYYILDSLSAGANDFARGCNYLEAQDMMLCHTVLRRTHSAGIFSNVSADKAVFITCGVRSKHQAFLF